MLKRIKKPTEHREGQMIRLVDAIHALCELKYDRKLRIQIGNGMDVDFKYNPKIIEKMIAILDAIWSWDITEIGNLYLTTGGRVVLDKGTGEYFTKGDKIIFTLEELKSGIKYGEFIKRVTEIKN